MTFYINSTWKPWKKLHFSFSSSLKKVFNFGWVWWHENWKKKTRKKDTEALKLYKQSIFTEPFWSNWKTFLLVHAYINIRTLIYNDFVIFESEVCKSSSQKENIVGNKSMLYPSEGRRQYMMRKISCFPFFFDWQRSSLLYLEKCK